MISLELLILKSRVLRASFSSQVSLEKCTGFVTSSLICIVGVGRFVEFFRLIDSRFALLKLLV